VDSQGRGHTKETGNRNATPISENCYQTRIEHVKLNGAAQIEEIVTQLEEDSETQLPGN
jgi:hypothetical protein